MPLTLVRQDITKMACDAIVNATNSALTPGGGLDAAIHAAAGPRLALACRRLGNCPAGQVRLTRGYGLPCRYVIHAVGPVWQGGGQGERELLESCYRSALELAARKRCRSVAFPLISASAFGYPKEKALHVAVESIGAFLLEQEMQVYLVLFGREDFRAGNRLFTEIQSYIDDNYTEARADPPGRSRRIFAAKDEYGATMSFESFSAPARAAEDAHAPESQMLWAPHGEPSADFRPALSDEKRPRHPPPAGARTETALPPKTAAPFKGAARAKTAAAAPRALEDALRRMDESFQQMLLRKIDEKGLTDAACYKKANIDRKLFSKIRRDVHYKPSKSTAIAFAVALELPLGETGELLRKAGYALSHSSKFDVIVEYFIANGNYDIYEINEALFAFDQNLLGA